MPLVIHFGLLEITTVSLQSYHVPHAGGWFRLMHGRSYSYVTTFFFGDTKSFSPPYASTPLPMIFTQIFQKGLLYSFNIFAHQFEA